MAQKIWTRDFLLVCSAQFFFSIVFFVLLPTIPIYLSRMGRKEAEIGVLVGILAVTSLIVRPLVGRALASTSEKRFLVAGTVICVFCSLAYPVAYPFFPFFALRAFQGIGIGLFSTGGITLAVRLSPANRLGESISYYYMVINLATASGPALGMLLINHFDFTGLFLFCAALCLCSSFVTLKLADGRHGSNQKLKEQPLLSRKALAPATMAFISNNIWGALTAFFPLFALTRNVPNPGVFFAVMAIVLVLGRGFGAKLLNVDRKSRVIIPCFAAQIAAMVILAFSAGLPMFLMAAAILGIGNAFLYPLMLVIASDRAGSSQGPAMGTYTAMLDLGTGTGSVVMGMVVQWTSYQTMFLCLAFMSFFNLFYYNQFVNRKE